MLAVFGSAFLFFHPGGEALGGPSFEGYVGSFVAANPPELAPDIPFFDANGAPHPLSEYRGKVVLVNFWASWCPACIMEMPALDRLQAELGGAGFVVLAISQDRGGAAVVRRFFESHKLAHLSVLVDGQRGLGMAFNQDMLPTTVLLDPAGREVGRLIGPADWASPGAVAFVKGHMRKDGK
jgi:thiol-disulfide isomerase/thioredoxin